MLMRTAEDEEEARDSSVSSSLARQGSSHSPTHTQVSEMPNADESERIQEMRYDVLESFV